MSSADYATMVLLETHAGVLSFGNHTCRPDVCHKGRGVGRLGFCRMMFWHWAKVENKKGEEEAKRRHGLLLQSHWDGVGWPPVQPLPHIGAPALEVNSHWYMKMHPGIALGPRCNHDVGVLLRVSLPPIATEPFPSTDLCSVASPGQLDAATEEAIDSTIDALIDHERYCGAYAYKEEPLIAGAFF